MTTGMRTPLIRILFLRGFSPLVSRASSVTSDEELFFLEPFLLFVGLRFLDPPPIRLLNIDLDRVRDCGIEFLNKEKWRVK